MLAPHLERIGGVVLEPTAFQVRLAGAKGVLSVWPRDVWSRAPVRGWSANSTEYNTVYSATKSAGDSAEGGYEEVSVHVWLRDSMVKFESARMSLEVVNWSRFMPCYLNRQIITLLSTLGVPDQVFLDLQVRPRQALARSNSVECDVGSSTVQYCAVPNCTVQCSAGLHCTVLYATVQSWKR